MEYSMAAEIRVPQMGESVTEGVVGPWLKKEGDPVSPDEPVVTLETEKVAVDVVPEQPGMLERILQPEGASVKPGDVLATVAPLAATSGAGTPGRPSRPGTAEEGSGAVTPPAARAAVEVSAQGAPSNGAATPIPAEETAATPVARRLAAEHNVDLAQIPGSGPGGRRTKEDVAAFLDRTGPPQAAPGPAPPRGLTAPAAAQQAAQQPVAPTEPQPALTPLAALFPSPEREERTRMSQRRLTIARRLVEAQHTAAILTTFNEIDMSAVMEVRQRRRDAFKERHGVGLGFMSFFTKAVVGALKAFPRLNAEIQGNEIVLKYHYDIGIAVGAEEGLVVPVLRDADRKSFAQIEREIADMAVRARANKLTLAELQGGTFTITNGGIFGSLLSTPILNAPEVGILGMHKIEERPIAVRDAVVIRPMMYVALSYDHRIVDGREAVQFLVHVKELVEDPETLLLEG
jgi:2-oxoglutarate dehydrogenase E2 component (dihydrolipoamide succinyltransferase)